MTAIASFEPAFRISGIGVSEILARGAKAAALKRSGHPMVILGAGEPDFDTPEHIKDAACAAIRQGQTKYTVLDGSGELKDAVRSKFLRENGLEFGLEQITCGAGAKQILYNAFMATLNEGDEVIIPAPFWTSYADIVAIAGGIPRVLACSEANGFLLQPDQLDAAINFRTRWVLLNSPSNPSGAAYSASELAALATVVRGHPAVWVMTDDMYEHIVYDDFEFATFAQVAPDLRDRTLTINGVSKAYAMTGWRIGYGAGPAALIRAMAVVQSQSTSCPSSVSQAAAIAALNGPQDCVREFTRSFEQRRNFVVDALNAIPGIRCRSPKGTFYAYASCSDLIGAKTRTGHIIGSDSDFADYLLDHGVALVPGSCFGLAPYFRISFASSTAELDEAFESMRIACADLAHTESPIER